MTSTFSASARRIALVCQSFAASLLLSSAASAASLPIFNTGVDAAGMALASPGSFDSHWRVDGLPAITAVDPNNGWIANVVSGPNQSGWIAPNPQGQQGANSTYALDFFIPAGAKNLSLSGKWATDDSARLYLNGQEILGARTDGASSPWTVFQSFAADNTALFLPGATNQLRAEVVNVGGPTGIQAQFSGSYSPAAAPGPLPVLGMAAAFRGSRRLRQRLRSQSS